MDGFDMRFADVVKCAANLVMAMCLWCTADSLAVNHPNCSFSFSLLSKSCDYRQSSMFSPWNRCGVLSFKQRSHRSLRNAPIRGLAIPEVWLPTKGFWRFLKPFSSLCRGLHAGKAIRPHLYSHFSNLRALGLPMCHIFPVSGSSLPVPIFIGRRFDQIILQAEVMESGMKVLPHMVGHEWQRLISGNFIQLV